RDLEDLGGRVVGDSGAGVEAGAVAPVDARRVIRSGPVGVGVGEAGDHASEGRALGRSHRLGGGGEAGISHVSGAVRGVRGAVVGDAYADRSSEERRVGARGTN